MFFETYKDKPRRQWRWRLKAGNGRILAHGTKGFQKEEQAATAACNAAKAILRLPEFPSITAYKNSDGSWRWLVRESIARTLADSAEAYTRRTNAVRVINKVYAAISAPDSVEVRSAP